MGYCLVYYLILRDVFAALCCGLLIGCLWLWLLGYYLTGSFYVAAVCVLGLLFASFVVLLSGGGGFGSCLDLL